MLCSVGEGIKCMFCSSKDIVHFYYICLYLCVVCRQLSRLCDNDIEKVKVLMKIRNESGPVALP